MSKELLQSPDLEKNKNPEQKDIGVYIPIAGIDGKKENSDTYNEWLAESLDGLDKKAKIDMNVGIPKPTIYTEQFAQLQSQNSDFWNKRKTSYETVAALIPERGILSRLAS